MNFLGIADRGRPAMEYIWSLQAKVDALRAEVRALKGPVRRFRLLSFLAGLLIGLPVGFWIWRLL